MPLDTTTAVSTPERVMFRYRIAGPGRRAVAWILDAVLQLTLLAVVGLFVALLTWLGMAGMGTGGLLVTLFIVQWFYGAGFESLTGGRTPGKRLMSLRVVTLEGAPATPRQFILRHLLDAADFLPVFFGVGVLVMAGNPRLRRLGDWAAGTVVVDESLGTIRGGVRIDPPVSEEERRSLPARIELTRNEVRTIEDFLRRRPGLSDGRARELAEILAIPLAAQLGIHEVDPERTLVLAYARATGRDRELG